MHGLGSKGGAVVKALTSHQCGPGSKPQEYFISTLSLIVRVNVVLNKTVVVDSD